MHDHQQCRADQHDRRAPSFAIVDAAEQRCQQYVAERQQRRDRAGKLGRNMEFLDHQFGSVLQEREHGRIEEYAENRNIPERLDAGDPENIGKTELLLVGLLVVERTLRFRFAVVATVHHAEHQERQQPDAEHNQADQQRSARTAHRPGERKRAEHRDRRPDTPRSDVQPQG